MKKKFTITDEDKQLFRKAMRDVNPLTQYDKHIPEKNHLKSNSNEFVPKNMPIHDELQHDVETPANVSQEDSLFFARSGIGGKPLYKLQRGKYAIQANLDLHGLTAEQAQDALENFIHDCYQQGLKVVRVIHGKGYRSHQTTPILKNGVNYWLRRFPQVLAFCSSRREHGGTGSVYVLLKSQ